MSGAPASGVSGGESVWRPRFNPWAIALTVTLATFMEVLDTSIANVALPHIAGSLSAGQDESTWVLTSYLVSNAIVLPISAWLATRLGRKRFYMSCVALFGISSLLCGLAPSLPWLIFFRVLQGLGGGGLAPSEQAILADTFEPAKRGMAFAVYGLAVVLAPAIGPTLGGYITDNFDWRWIFFINVPVALLSLTLSSRLVEDPPFLEEERKKKYPVDYAGLALLALGLGCLQVVLDKGEREDWFSSQFIKTFAAITVVSLVGAVVWEYFEEHPIIDLKLLRNPNFSISCVMMFALGMSLYGTTVLIPQLLQLLMGYTAELAGMTLSFGGFVVVLCMPLVGILVSKIDARHMIAFGFLTLGLGLYLTAGLDLLMDFRTASTLRVVYSLGLPFLFVPISTMSYVGIPAEKNNNVSGMTNLARNIGGSVGISMVTTLLAQRAQHHQDTLRDRMTLFDPGFRASLDSMSRTLAEKGVGLADATQQAYGRLYLSLQGQANALAYIDVAWVFAAICFAVAPLAFLMKKPRGGGEIHMH
jgi:DHA2 family multidrug resistance protein